MEDERRPDTTFAGKAIAEAPFVRSQIGTGPLPFEQSFGLLSVQNAAGQIGLLGIATGNEVQLDSVSVNGFSPINICRMAMV